MKKQIRNSQTWLFSLGVATLLLMQPFTQPVMAQECLFAYKAKRDKPLQLHFGVMQINGRCDPTSASEEVSERLRTNGWNLLVLLERVEPGSEKKYRETAGEYFLRY